MFHRNNRSYTRNGIVSLYILTGILVVFIYALGVSRLGLASVFDGSHLLILGFLGMGSGLLLYLQRRYAQLIAGVYTALVVFFSMLAYITIYDAMLRLIVVTIATIFTIVFLYLMMSRKKPMTIPARKIFYGVALCVLLISALMFYVDNLSGGKIRNTILQEIKQNCDNTEQCIIDMRTIADDFEWDTLYAFSDSVDADEMKKVLGTETSGKREFSYQVVFSNKGKVVLREYEEMDMDQPLEIVFEGTYEKPYYAQYSKDEAVFLADSASRYGRYLLVPVR